MNKPAKDSALEYATPQHGTSRPLSAVAAASVILPLMYTLVIPLLASDPETTFLDDRLAFGVVGMFWTKLFIFAAVPFFCMFLAVWSIIRIRQNLRISGISVAIIAILMNSLMVARQTYVIYHLYAGYFR